MKKVTPHDQIIPAPLPLQLLPSFLLKHIQHDRSLYTFHPPRSLLDRLHAKQVTFGGLEMEGGESMGVDGGVSAGAGGELEDVVRC
jgi:hypothetical protein